MLDLGSQIGHRFSLYVFMLGVVLRNDRLFFFFASFPFLGERRCLTGGLAGWGPSSQMDRVVLRPPRVLGLPRALRGLLAEDVPGPTRRLAE